MGVAQNALLGAVGTGMGLATAGTYLAGQAEGTKKAAEANEKAEQANALKKQEMEERKAGEVAQAETRMTEAALRGTGKFEEEDIQGFKTAQALGLKEGSAAYKPQYSEMKRIYSEEVLGSETLAKIKQDAAYRARFLAYTNTIEGRLGLAKAVEADTAKDYREQKELLKGGKK